METLKIVLITKSGYCCWVYEIGWFVDWTVIVIAVHGVQKMCHFFWRGKGIQGSSEENVYCSKLKIGYGCHVDSGVES